MNKFSRFLTKLIFIIIVSVLLILITLLTRLHATTLMLFFIFISNTWKYGTIKLNLNDIDDYYSLFNLNENFNKKELEDSYNLELEKLNNDFSITAENKISLIAFINTAFDTLNDPISKSEYDIKYNFLLDGMKKEKANIELQNKKLSTYCNGLLNYNMKPFKNYAFFSKNTIGLLACLIIDMVFIIPLLLKN